MSAQVEVGSGSEQCLHRTQQQLASLPLSLCPQPAARGRRWKTGSLGLRAEPNARMRREKDSVMHDARHPLSRPNWINLGKVLVALGGCPQSPSPHYLTGAVQCNAQQTRPRLLQQPRKHGQRIYLTCIVPPDPTATPRRTSQHRRRPSQNTPPSHPPTTHSAPPFAAALRSAVAPAKHRPPCLSGP